MLHPFSAHIKFLFSVCALQLLIACHICWFLESHVCDRAIFFYSGALRYADYEVMSSIEFFIKKFVVAWFVIVWAFIFARACWIIVYNWSDHFPEGGGAALSAVSHSIDAVLNYWGRSSNIEAILRLMFTVLTSIALRVKRIVSIVITLQTVAKTARSQPNLINQVIWILLWANVTVMQDHIDEWLHFPALL